MTENFETDPARAKRFAVNVLSHLNAAYNLARWLAKSDRDAADIVQDAYLRAYKFFDGFRGADGRPWLLAIVRNASSQWLTDQRASKGHESFDEELHSEESEDSAINHGRSETNPASILERRDDAQQINAALLKLPTEFREALVLRDVRDLSAQDFPLIGGRLDYVGGRPVAALIYRHRQHLIAVDERPAHETQKIEPKALSRQGYHVVTWSDGAMARWAVSDLDPKELMELVEMLRGP